MNDVVSVFFSRKHTVSLCRQDGKAVVQKEFSTPEAFRHEAACYERFAAEELSIPDVLCRQQQTLWLSYIPGFTALELLEQAETHSPPDLSLWKALTRWCCTFYDRTGMCLGDPNLRNFILHTQTGQWYGLDFEACHIGAFHEDFAGLLAFLVLYNPIHSAVKQTISAAMRTEYSKITGYPEEKLEQLQLFAEKKLLARRSCRT